MARARFSEVLANRRHQLGITIPQAAQVLRLRADVLEAFESGDFDAMPTNGYAQGMLSSYARYLDLNPTEIVDMFCDELEAYRRHNPSSPRAGDADSGRAYPQGRPYTSRAPYEAQGRNSRQASARRNALRRSERSHAENGGYQYRRYGTSPDNIHTMRVDESRYEDDLGFSNNAQPYRAASTPEGRTYRQGASARADRPNVQRRQPSSASRRVRTTTRSSRSRGRRSGRVGRFFEDPAHAFFAVALAVIVILTVVIILSVSSCVSNELGKGEKSVAVNSAQSSSDASSTPSDPETEAKEENAREQLSAIDNTSGDTSTDAQTNVTVSVADGAVTWLEVDNDGTSDIADTVTGPWERSYVVTDSITIQAHDTSSVTVTRNGKQVQFDTLAGGVGTVTIKGTKPADDAAQSEEGDTSSDASASEAGSSEGSQASAGSSKAAQGGAGNSGAAGSGGGSQARGSGSGRGSSGSSATSAGANGTASKGSSQGTTGGSGTSGSGSASRSGTRASG